MTRGRGAALGALAGALLGVVETATRWVPASVAAGLHPDPGPPLAATSALAALGALAGALHPALGLAAVIGVAALSADRDLLGFLAAPAACALAAVLLSRPRALLATGASCLLAAVAAGVTAPGGPPPPSVERSHPDVLLVVLDTVGARATSLHGHPLPTTPALEALAREGAWFTQALATAPWTVPSHASLLSGLHPRAAGAHHEHVRLLDDVPTTAEAFAAAGYRTGAFAGNPWLAPATGLTRGFTRRVLGWDLMGRRNAFALMRARDRLCGAPHKGGPLLVEALLGWLDRSGETPSFALLNLLDAHSPYQAVGDPGRFGVDDPAALGRRLDAVQRTGERAAGFPRPGELDAARRLYAAAVRYADDQLARLVAGLRARGRLDDTLLVVTSDHGEAFGEHAYFGHLVGLYAHTLHVPLVVRLPERVAAGRRIDVPVSLRRIHPTLLHLALGAPAGDSLLGDSAAEEPVISEQRRPLRPLAAMAEGDAELAPLDRRALRVQRGSLALLRETPAGEDGEPRWSLYDVAEDPDEQRDLLPDPRAEALRGVLEAHDARPVRGEGELLLDPELVERLRALGYLGP